MPDVFTVCLNKGDDDDSFVLCSQYTIHVIPPLDNTEQQKAALAGNLVLGHRFQHGVAPAVL